MSGAPPGASRAIWRMVAVAWVIGAVVVWNGVFDAHVRRGARDYVDRQQRFVEGRGPSAGMDDTMSAAVASGWRSAARWTLVELLPGAVLTAWVRRGRRPA